MVISHVTFLKWRQSSNTFAGIQNKQLRGYFDLLSLKKTYFLRIKKKKKQLTFIKQNFIAHYKVTLQENFVKF